MKFYKLAAAMIVLSLSTSSFAANKKDLDDDYNANDYDSAYYENEGRIMVKIRGSGLISHAKQKGLPAPTSRRGKAAPQGSSSFITNGYGVEAATVLFFGDNFGAELSTGVQVYRTSKTAIGQVGYNYSDTAVPGKRKNIYGIPVNLTLQWHFAPFGAIRPYVGGGYNGTYFIAKAQEYKIKSTTGPVIQAGVDFVMTDDTVLSLDVKKVYISPRVSYKSSFIPSSVSGKVPINPWVISAGLGWKF